jgi:hypothetical protein
VTKRKLIEVNKNITRKREKTTQLSRSLSASSSNCSLWIPAILPAQTTKSNPEVPSQSSKHCPHAKELKNPLLLLSRAPKNNRNFARPILENLRKTKRTFGYSRLEGPEIGSNEWI